MAAVRDADAHGYSSEGTMTEANEDIKLVAIDNEACEHAHAQCERVLCARAQLADGSQLVASSEILYPSWHSTVGKLKSASHEPWQE